jgi:SWI/SNF-related matrix-associated actin-dependent regulator of chromatin subfamily A member 5
VQQGRLADQSKSLGKDELLAMIRYGADEIIHGVDTENFDIDEIMHRGEAKTEEMAQKYKDQVQANFGKEGTDGTTNFLRFDGGMADDSGALDGLSGSNFVLDIGPRERKNTGYNVEQLFRSMQGEIKPHKPRQPRLANRPQMHDFQFYNTARLNELFDKEDQLKQQRSEAAQLKGDKAKVDPNLSEEEQKLKEQQDRDEEEALYSLSAEDSDERDALLNEGFGSWLRRDFNAFQKACERHGRQNLKAIAAEIEGKELEEVERYSKVFWARYKELAEWERIYKNIERGEGKIQRREEIQVAIQKKFQRYTNPWMEMKISYGPNKGKGFNEEEDRYLLCLTHQLGYGRWEEMKWEIRKSWEFRFDWFIKSRLPVELNRRVDTLVRLIEKEIEQEELKEKEQRKKKRLSEGSAGGSSKVQKTH